MDVPAGLGERGSALWAALSGDDVARNVLVLESARLADRLDELDSIIQGKGVLDLMQFRLDFPSEENGPFTVEVKFQNVLAEARQQASALAAILGKLTAVDGAVSSKVSGPVPENVTPLDAIMRRGLKKA